MGGLVVGGEEVVDIAAECGTLWKLAAASACRLRILNQISI